MYVFMCMCVRARVRVRVRMRMRVRVNEFPCIYLPRKGSVKWRNMLCPFVIKGQQPC